jgi:hypothetical protein
MPKIGIADAIFIPWAEAMETLIPVKLPGPMTTKISLMFE